jgi:uncharacterized membrane protein YkvA (DUF1232 family)
MKGEIRIIDYKTAIDFLMPRHYAGRKPQITKAWGWYDDVFVLQAVCTIGKPASPPLCMGICGKENSHYVYELNRLCREDDWKEPLSHFIGEILHQCKANNWVIVAFSDTDMHHNGYIYQACNFMYTGITKERTDKYTEGNKHCRHYDNEKQKGLRKVRTAKHRYVYFCTRDKRLKKAWISALHYAIQPYPKGENQTYKLGEYQKTKLVESAG